MLLPIYGFPLFIFQVKYGGTLKRLYASANGMDLDINLSALRAKIANTFKFDPDAEFVLTYTDEDGDAVMLDDDDDLRDAALHQKLNPLRINVQLKISYATEQQKTNSESAKPTAQDILPQIIPAIETLKPISKSSTAQEECLAEIKSAVGEAIKSIPEPIPDALAKLSHEVLDSAPQPFAELLKHFVQLIVPNNINGSSDVHAEGASSSLSGTMQTQMPVAAKANDEPEASANLVSRPLNVQKSDLPKERGCRSVLNEAVAVAPPLPGARASQGQQPSLYPSVEELLFPSNSVDKSVSNKGRSDAQSKGKPVVSSTEEPALPVITTPAPLPPPSISEWFQPRRCHSHRWQYEANAKDTADSRWPIPMHNVPFGPSTPFPHAPPGYGSSPHFPYPGRLLSFERVYGDTAERIRHEYIQCDACGLQPIVGPRYKSNV
jgi:next to BRCA1 gene 1 protein